MSNILSYILYNLWTYSVIKLNATGFVYLKGSPYRNAEVPSQLISCLHDVIINATPKIGKELKKKLYRQCPPRRVKDKNIK